MQLSSRTSGLLFGLGAYLTWGLSPVYFKALQAASAPEIVAHRVVWSVLFLSLLLAARGRLRALLRSRPSWGRAGLYAATTSLIAGNWLLFIWAVNSGHLIEASLGYFINPLVNVLLGLIFLKEALNRWQAVAVLTAAAGVLYQVVGLGKLPVISLVLAVSFGIYGLLRKKGRVDPIAGLLIETALIAPLAGLYLGALSARGGLAFGTDAQLSILLAASGAITALPLIWFQLGANRLRLSTIGLLQYLSPSLQLLLAVGLYGEGFTHFHAVTFGLIWISLGIYTADAIRQQRRSGIAQAAAPARA